MAKSNLKVALTGGIASGKSQVSALLEGHGCFIIDLDVIAREVVEPGTAGLNKLIENFGNSQNPYFQIREIRVIISYLFVEIRSYLKTLNSPKHLMIIFKNLSILF